MADEVKTDETEPTSEQNADTGTPKKGGAKRKRKVSASPARKVPKRAKSAPVTITVSPSKAKKKPAAKVASPAGGGKKKSAKSSHPRTLDMVIEAIKALKDNKGSSVQAIRTWILANYKTVRPDMVKVMLKRALEQGLDTKLLSRPKTQATVQILSGRYRVAGKSTATAVVAGPAKKKKKETPSKAKVIKAKAKVKAKPKLKVKVKKSVKKKPVAAAVVAVKEEEKKEVKKKSKSKSKSKKVKKGETKKSKKRKSSGKNKKVSS